MTLDRRAVLAGLAAAPLAAQTPPPSRANSGPVPGLPDPRETIDLWPRGAPGLLGKPPIEAVNERSTDSAFPDRAVFGITRPRMVVFRPTVPNGSAVLVMPGGGYKWVVIDKEGYEIARWLSARGFTVFVLFYRLPGEGWAAGPSVALSDAQRAIRLIRARAQHYGVSPDRVVAMGFSAGGHVCGELATRFDAPTYAATDAADMASTRPNAVALLYAVQSMSAPLAHSGSRELLLGRDVSPASERAHTPARNVTAQTPPTFLIHAEDDTVVSVENTIAYRAALKAASVPAETHLFTHGGHGFGLRRAAGKPAAVWPELFLSWAAFQGAA